MSRSARGRSLRTQAKLVFIRMFRGCWLPGVPAAALRPLPSLDPLIQRADAAKRAPSRAEPSRSMTSSIGAFQENASVDSKLGPSGTASIRLYFSSEEKK